MKSTDYDMLLLRAINNDSPKTPSIGAQVEKLKQEIVELKAAAEELGASS